MSAQFGTGLIVGKFAPLHRGHELLIARARAACRRVWVFSYVKPEFALCEPVRRKGWLDARSPDTTNLVFGADGFVAGVAAADLADARALARAMPAETESPDAQRRYVAAVCARLVGRVDAVFSSEDYGEPFAAVLAAAQGAPVVHVMVDRARQAVPISATAIRRDPHAARGFLSPEVYAAFVARVCILGAESTGKTTLAQALASEFGTQWVPEYGRELWEQKAGALAYDDLLHIAHEQLAREDRLAERAVRFLFCDTSPRTTAFYSDALFGRVDPRLAALCAREYAHTVLCARDIPFEQDGTRQDEAFATRQQSHYEAALAAAGVRPIRVFGDVAARVAQVREQLAR